MSTRKDDLWFSGLPSDPSSDGVHFKRFDWIDVGKDLPDPTTFAIEWPVLDAEPFSSDLSPRCSPHITSSPAIMTSSNEILAILRPQPPKPRVISAPPRPNGTETREIKSRKRFPLPVKDILIQWLKSHSHHPYPSREEYENLAIRTGLTKGQLSVWLVNNRARILHRSEKNANLPDGMDLLPM
jgi:hypothetical protein